MLVPIVGLISGILIVLYTVLAYTGNLKISLIPIAKIQKGNLPLAIGNILIALALVLGIAGYLNYFPSEYLRYFRLFAGSFGLSLVIYQVYEVHRVNNFSLKRIRQRANYQRRQTERYLELLQVLVNRSLKVRYRGSFLGVYWSLLNPLIMTGLYTAIFGATFASYYNNSIINYVLAAFTGLVVINFFSASTSQALSSVVGNGALLNKIKLPISVFPMSTIAGNVFQFLVGTLPLLAIMTFINSKSLINVIALLFPFIALILVCTGVGFLVSALYVFFRDLPYFYELMVFVIWVSSPVFYPAAIVPDKVKPFLALNPLSPIIESLRQIALSQTMPDFLLIGDALLRGLIILPLGYICFNWWRSQFMDLL
jgi:ABC-2 type transport system permease protein/lipopolysaccharide transport system permease protein